MANWTAADLAILAVAAFIAVTTLVRLMINHRNSLVRELEEQAHRAKQAAARQRAAEDT